MTRAIIAPFFMTFFRLPVCAVSGASLMDTFVISVAGVAFYQAITSFYSFHRTGPAAGYPVRAGGHSQDVSRSAVKNM
jgi:hypothetical protein